jgi:hypothetical protein
MFKIFRRLLASNNYNDKELERSKIISYLSKINKYSGLTVVIY